MSLCVEKAPLGVKSVFFVCVPKSNLLLKKNTFRLKSRNFHLMALFWGFLFTCDWNLVGNFATKFYFLIFLYWEEMKKGRRPQNKTESPMETEIDTMYGAITSSYFVIVPLNFLFKVGFFLFG